MLFTVEQAFVGREEIRAPLKTPAWEAMCKLVLQKLHLGPAHEQKQISFRIRSRIKITTSTANTPFSIVHTNPEH